MNLHGISRQNTKFTFERDNVSFEGKHDSARCLPDGINSERSKSHSRVFLAAYTSSIRVNTHISRRHTTPRATRSR